MRSFGVSIKWSQSIMRCNRFVASSCVCERVRASQIADGRAMHLRISIRNQWKLMTTHYFIIRYSTQLFCAPFKLNVITWTGGYLMHRTHQPHTVYYCSTMFRPKTDFVFKVRHKCLPFYDRVKTWSVFNSFEISRQLESIQSLATAE